MSYIIGTVYFWYTPPLASLHRVRKLSKHITKTMKFGIPIVAFWKLSMASGQSKSTTVT